MPRVDTYYHLLSGDKLLSRKGTFEGIESSIVGKATRWRRLSLVQECSVYGVLWWRVALALAFFYFFPDLFHWNHGWSSWWLVRPNIVPVMYYDRIVILRDVVPNTSRSCHSTSTLLHSSCFFSEQTIVPRHICWQHLGCYGVWNRSFHRSGVLEMSQRGGHCVFSNLWSRDATVAWWNGFGRLFFFNKNNVPLSVQTKVGIFRHWSLWTLVSLDVVSFTLPLLPLRFYQNCFFFLILSVSSYSTSKSK